MHMNERLYVCFYTAKLIDLLYLNKLFFNTDDFSAYSSLIVLNGV